jgi:tetratricopeptide (TPR) repeat protein
VAGIAAVLALAALWGFREGGLRTVAVRTPKLGLAALLAIAVLWAQYGFRFNAGPDGSDAYNRAMPDKIADLNIPHWREGIALADRHRLLPRAYLWGLADTVRAGVEGRGQSSNLLWGEKYTGKAPWFTWPSVMASKLPLALALLSLLGLAALPFSTLAPRARWVLAALLGGSAAHLLALMSSQGTYGGMRHALPLVVSLGILAGAAVAFAWQARSRAGAAAVALLLVAALGMTIREPRLWEYHNELAGGSADAWRYFGNEGLDLGQRYPEIRAFHDRVIKPSGASLYSEYWFGEKQAIADRLNYRKRVQDLQDDNVAGIYDGYFLVGMTANLPEPDWGWDPKKAFAGTREVARLGYVQVRHGRMTDPMGRAGSLYHRAMEYLYRENGRDDALLAKRLEEVVKVLPPHAGAGIELGNAYLRLGRPADARVAYRRLLDQQQAPVEALVRAQVEAQLALIDKGVDATRLKPLRNPWME